MGETRAPSDDDPTEARTYVRRHLRLGWWSVLVFLTMGAVLEALHGFKVDWYLNVANETRRLMWTLAHAHGVLIGLLHVGFAASLLALGGRAAGSWCRYASAGLIGATLLLPGGFFLGGLWIYGGDPGRGVLLVPVGALLLFLGVATIAWRVTRAA